MRIYFLFLSFSSLPPNLFLPSPWDDLRQRQDIKIKNLSFSSPFSLPLPPLPGTHTHTHVCMCVILTHYHLQVLSLFLVSIITN